MRDLQAGVPLCYIVPILHPISSSPYTVIWFMTIALLHVTTCD